MKTFKELVEAMTMQQRLKRGRQMKVKSKLIARKRALAMKKPPSPERINKAVQRAVRNKALSLVDKQGIYKGASAGIKQSIEKKADKKVQKVGAKWYKRLRPQVRAKMKDAYKTRMGKGSTSVLHDEE
jgi:hypothetical protein